MLILAAVQTTFAGFTALVGAFADGGDTWSRLLVILVHPVCAAGLLLLVILPRPATAVILAIAGLLAVNVAADAAFALLIAAGTVKGDWWLPLVFSAIPAIGIVYALTLLRASRSEATQRSSGADG